MKERDSHTREEEEQSRLGELMNRTDPIVDWSVIVEHSSYAKPTLSSKFKMVRKTVNKLAKYRPTQDVPGINWNQKGNKSKNNENVNGS